MKNAAIAAAARRHRLRDGDPVSFHCECDDPLCSASVSLSLRPYDRLRDEYLYIVAAGHTIAAGSLAASGSGFSAFRATG